MTASMIDRLSRMLAAPVSRRSVMAAAPALAVSAAVPGQAAAGSSRGHGGHGRGHGHGEVEAEGARKRGKGGKGKGGDAGVCRTSGACTRSTDCCSGRCAGRNGRKRCRCLAAGAACANDKACCSGLACVEGACREAGVPTPPPAPLPACDVCPNGCRFASVEAAWAATPEGGVISIAPGTWPTTITVDRSMTLEACEGRDGVALQPRAGSDHVLLAPAAAPANLSLTLSGLTFRTAGIGTGSLVQLEAPGITAGIVDCRFDLSEFGLMVTSDGGEVSVSGSVFTGIGGELGAGISFQTDNGSLAISDSSFSTCSTGVAAQFNVSGQGTFDSAEFTGCGTGLDLTGQFDPAAPGEAAFSVTGCQAVGNIDRGIRIQGGVTVVSGSVISGNGGTAAFTGGLTLQDGELTIEDTDITGNVGQHGGIWVVTDGAPAKLVLGNDVLISGNTATDFGGGVTLQAKDAPIALRVTGGNVAIAGNSAPRASGVAVITTDRAGVSVIGVNNQIVTRNAPGIQCMSSRNEGRAFSEVATCVFGF